MAEDRRIRYTKASLKSSLLELLHQKPLSKVSVKELCELADVNRGTFYAHYKSPEVLMSSIEDEFMAGLVNHLKNQSGSDSPLEINTKVLEFIMANKSLCQIILSCKENDSDLRDAVASLYEQFAPIWLGEMSGTAEGEYVFTFIISGSVGMIRDWLNSPNPASPKAMAALMQELVQNGLGFLKK